MARIVAYCGLYCDECGAYIATQNNDDAKRKEIAEAWSREYKTDIKPGDINCDGCLVTTSRVFNHCNVCPIRKCGQEKGVENCAYCGDYACDELNRYFEMAPVMKANLEEIRKGLQ